MRKDAFKTPFGEIWLWSDPGALDTPRPLALFLNGAFSIERPRSFELQALLPEAVVLNAHLPGNHSPPPIAHSIGVYAAAYSAVLDHLARPAIVIGASVGAITAMAMRSPAIRGLVLLEPFLETGGLTPLIEPFRARLHASPHDAGLRDFLWSVFGIGENASENRDYRTLLETLETPAWAAFGGVRSVQAGEGLASLVSDVERELFRARPGVRTEVIEGVGHNLPGRAPYHVRRYAQDLLDAHVLKTVRQGDRD